MNLAVAALGWVLLIGGVPTDQPGGVPADPSSLRGTVGVCVRWGADPHHIADAVVVVSSGNAALDEAMPRSVEAMKWDRPTSPTYHGEWIGMNLSVEEAPPPSRPLPNCAGLETPAPNA